jgi:hypothetical protein
MNSGGRSKFLKTEVLAGEEFVLGIQPLCPPTMIVLRHLEIEIVDVLVHLATEAASLVVRRTPDGENSTPKHPVGFDPKEAFADRDETRNVENSVGIQIVKLNPIGKEKTSKEKMRGKRMPPKEKCKKKYPEARRWLGMISGPAARTSARSFFKMPIFSALASSLSPILVWTQFPIAGGSASSVLAFFAAAPPVAPVAVELLLPMTAALNENFAGMGGRRDALQEKCARKKMTAAEWGKQLLLRCHFYLKPGNHWSILAAHCEGETARWIWPSTCQHNARCGLHY